MIAFYKDCIYKIKTKFNEEFTEVMKMKQSEIKKIQEKNVRMSKIIHDLKLNEEIFQPQMHIDEKPEELLKVYDEEVRYLHLSELVFIMWCLICVLLRLLIVGRRK